MRLSFGQQMQQSQKQILAPRMIQSMEILQLSITALEERIEKEMSENPLLEQREEDPDLPQEEVAEQESPDAPTVEERELVVDENKNNEDDFERLLNITDEWPDHFEERTRPSRNRLEEDSNRKHDALANMASRPQSLQNHLEEQVGEMDMDDSLHTMAVRIIYSLDSNGWLTGTLDDLLDTNADDAQRQLAREALAVVQNLDPSGVGAHDLRECLLLQLAPTTRLYEQVRTLVADHLEDLWHNRLPVIERRTGYSIELIQDALGELRKLNPKPGSIFNDEHVPTVTPDVFLEPAENGTYKVRLEDGNTPSLFISSYYRQRLSSGEASDEEREFIRRKINAAQWLIESIEQRRSTLTKVSQAIVDHQKAFLEQGPEFIEPLKMQQIADKVGVHVTTVSRAVDDKWIQTPRGIFFFTEIFRGRNQKRRRRGCCLRSGQAQAPRSRRPRRQDEPLQRRRSRQAARPPRRHGRTPYGHQIPQGDEHPQLARATRLVKKSTAQTACGKAARRSCRHRARRSVGSPQSHLRLSGCL